MYVYCSCHRDRHLIAARQVAAVGHRGGDGVHSCSKRARGNRFSRSKGTIEVGAPGEAPGQVTILRVAGSARQGDGVTLVEARAVGRCVDS